MNTLDPQIRDALVSLGVSLILGAGVVFAGFFFWLRRWLESRGRLESVAHEKEQAEARMMNTINDLVVRSAEERTEFLRTLNKLLDENREQRGEIHMLKSGLEQVQNELATLNADKRALYERIRHLEAENKRLEGELGIERNKRIEAEKSRDAVTRELQAIKVELAQLKALTPSGKEPASR